MIIIRELRFIRSSAGAASADVVSQTSGEIDLDPNELFPIVAMET